MLRSLFRKAAVASAIFTSVCALAWGVAGWPRGAVGEESPPSRQSSGTETPVSVNRSTGDDVASEKVANPANALSRAFRHAAEVAMPSVVTVRSKTKAQVAMAPRARGNNNNGNNGRGVNPFKGTPFEDFFNGQEFGDNAPQGRPQREGMGSGVIIDKAGIVLTNNHVVAGADEVLIQLADGREFKGEDIKTDEQTDLAVVHIKGAGSLPAAKLGNSDSLEIGDWVIAIGNPFELEHTVSAGIISGKGRELGSIRRAQFLQTDAAINPGNSGGPLIDLDGEVIGINTAIASNSGSFAGIGFAIPINTAKWVTSQLIKKGTVERAYLGVAIGEVTRELANKVGVKRGEGVLVSEVYPNTPASEAGLQDGDVVVKFADHKVHGPRELQELVERVPLDSKQSVEVIRDGKPVTLSITAKSLPKNFGALAGEGHEEAEHGEAPKFESNNLGLEVTELAANDTLARTYKGFAGVLISKVEPNGPAAEQGLREGMLVMKVGSTPVKTVEEFQKAVKSESLKDGVMLLVRTPRGNRFVVLH
jgi:serine protease Do